MNIWDGPRSERWQQGFTCILKRSDARMKYKRRGSPRIGEVIKQGLGPGSDWQTNSAWAPFLPSDREVIQYFSTKPKSS